MFLCQSARCSVSRRSRRDVIDTKDKSLVVFYHNLNEKILT
jgi:hypothetical protein